MPCKTEESWRRRESNPRNVPIEPGRRNQTHPHAADILGTLLLTASLGSCLTLVFGYWTGVLLGGVGAVALALAEWSER